MNYSFDDLIRERIVKALKTTKKAILISERLELNSLVVYRMMNSRPPSLAFAMHVSFVTNTSLDWILTNRKKSLPIQPSKDLQLAALNAIGGTARKKGYRRDRYVIRNRYDPWLDNRIINNLQYAISQKYSSISEFIENKGIPESEFIRIMEKPLRSSASVFAKVIFALDLSADSILVSEYDGDESVESGYGAPLSLYFDAEEFSPRDIAETIGLLSDLYREIGGDKLVIDSTSVLEPTQAAVPS